MSEFEPNAFDGFRPAMRVSDERIQVFVTVRGGGETLADHLVEEFPDTLEQRGRAQVMLVFLEAICTALNAGFNIVDLDNAVSSLFTLTGKYRVALPDNWFLLSIVTQDTEPQMVFASAEGECRVVSQDSYSEAVTLESLLQGDRRPLYGTRWPDPPEVQPGQNLLQEEGDS